MIILNEHSWLEDRLRISIILYDLDSMQKEIYTLVADFSMKENLAYLSHQESLMMFQRGFIRASVPLTYSGGFNPHPRLFLPFPRSVGVCSEADRLYATVEYSKSNFPTLKTLTMTVQQQLPKGCNIQFLNCFPEKITLFPQSVQYQFQLKTGILESLRSHLVACQKQIQEGERIEIQRYWAKKRRYKIFDIAPFLHSINFMKDFIEVECSVSQSGTVRVDELLDWLNIGLESLKEPVCRTGIRWCLN